MAERFRLVRLQRGMVLLSTLLVLSLLIAVGMGSRIMIHQSTGAAGNLRLSSNAFYLAEAGIEWSKHEISSLSSHPPIPANHTQNIASGSFSVVYGAATVSVLTAKIPVRSTGRSGTARHLVESRLTKNYELADGAVAVRGNANRVNLGGGAFVISGTDHDPSTGSAVSRAKARPGITVSGPALRDVVLNGLDPSQQNNVVGKGGTPAIVQSDRLPGPALVQIADDLCASPEAIQMAIPVEGNLSVAGATWGTQTAPQVRCIDGLPGVGDAVRLDGDISGVGILVVRNSQLIAGGSLRWEGLIIVTGDGVGFTAAGAAAKEIYGSVAVNETGSPESASAILDVNGSLRLLFSRSALNRVAVLIPNSALGQMYSYLPFEIVQDYWRTVTP